MSNKAHDQQMLRRAFLLHQAGDLGKAADLYSQIVKNDPNHFLALHYLGVVEATAGNFEHAKSLMARSLEIYPPNVQFVENYAAILFKSGDYGSALKISQQGLSINNTNVTLLYVSAISSYKLTRLQDSIAHFDKLLSLQPNHIAAHNERGSVLAEMKEYDAALASVQKALAFAPQYAEAHLNSGNLYVALKRFDEAITAYDKALALKPDLADAWLGRGNALRNLKRYDDSFAAYEKALSLNPDLANAWLGRGNIFFDLKRFADALAAYDRALTLKPKLADAWLSRGNALRNLQRYDDSFAAYEKALSLNPDLANAWLGRGNIFFDLERFADALAAYDRALTLNPDLEYAEGTRLYAKLSLCDWTDFDTELLHLHSPIRERKLPSPPLAILSISTSPADQLECARCSVQDQPKFAPICRGEVYSHDRIRVAYLSADFREHPVAYLTAGLFEQHDKSRFEVTGISFRSDNSPMQDRIKGAFERFVEADYKSDQEIAEFIRRSEIDIVIDLMGHTRHNRINVLARHPAPIQVNYLGYPGTMGADYIDYIVADRFVVSKTREHNYSEKIIYLPDVFQVNDSQRKISARTPARVDAGLPENAFVFCCFCKSNKITPPVFDIWMRLLQQNGNSILWLLADNPNVEGNLRKAAENRGVDSTRLIFAPVIPYSDYLARYRLADLFLDTLPFNAGTTASDALWAGVPLLTCSGEAFASRMAGSLLRAVGMPEMVTASMTDYEALACKFARDVDLMRSAKAKLARNRDTCPLFNTERFTRHIESAYKTIWERQQMGAMPESFSVDLINKCASHEASGVGQKP